MGLASHEGHLYIADAGNHRVLRVDPRSGTADVVFGAREKGRGLEQLMRPSAVAVHGDNLYIADSGNCRVLRAGLGAAKAELCLGGRGTGLSQLVDPCGLAFHKGRLYVADFGNHRVLRVMPGDPSSSEVCCGGLGRGSGPGQLAGPAAVDFCGEDLFVADFWNHRILRFRLGEIPAADGEVVFGGRGRGDGLDCLFGPRDLAFHRGRLYVADWGNDRVLELRPGDAVARPIVSPQGGLQHRGAMGFGDLRWPRGLVFHKGHLYVSDSENHRVLAY